MFPEKQSGREEEPHTKPAVKKVERCIRNINEEFLRLNPHLENIEEDLREFVRWHNNERFQTGINAIPADVYFRH